MSRRFGAAILGCAGLTLSAEERRFFAQAQPFGFILFARNIDTAEQLRALCADLRDAVGWFAPILIDQEGGRVQRLRPPLARDWLPPLDDVARLGDKAEAGMRLRYQIIGQELRCLGIDVNCAPMLDIATGQTHAFLRNRCYGETLETVVQIGRAVAAGLMAGGVSPVIKHIPGHGRSTLDTHLDLPRITEDPAVLRAQDFAAFTPFSDLSMGMTAHLVFDRIDPQPATVSPTMIGVIRDQIGFGGLLMTDDISMEALSGSVADRSAAAMAAGCDLVLHCNGDLAEMIAVMDKAGEMTEAAQSRAQAALNARPELAQVDIAGLEAEFEALVTASA